MKMRRQTAALLAMLMLLSLLGACTPSASQTQPTSAAVQTDAAQTSSAAPAPGTPEATPPGQLPVTTQPVTLTLGLRQNVQVTDYDDNYLTNYLEENTGVALSFVFFPQDSAEATQKLELMVASGQQLPDMLMHLPLSDLARGSYGAQGVLLPLDDYISNLAYFWNQTADNWATDEERDNIMKFGRSPDGHMYAYPFFVSDPTDSQALGGWINKSWLEKLNLPVPVTTDDLLTVLRAFRDGDPNGNGQPDEIPLVGGTGWVGDPAKWLMNAFIYYSDYMLNAENGKVSVPYTDEAFREGLVYLKLLVSEGLLSPLSFTQTNEQLKAMTDLTDDQASIVGIFTAHPHLMFSPDSRKRMEYTGIAPMVGPAGVSYAPKAVPVSSYDTFITKYCQYPEIAFRFLDFIASEEASITVRFGEKDVDWWDAPADAEPMYPALDYGAVYESENKIWGQSNNRIWNASSATFIPPALFGARTRIHTGSEEQDYRAFDWADSIVLRNGKNPPELVSKLLFTEEETAEVTEMRTTIETYVRESVVRFVTGDLDIDRDWDAYIKDLEAMGLARYLDIVQTCYTRMNS